MGIRLQMQTALGREIDNEQFNELTRLDWQQIQEYEQGLAPTAKVCTGPTPRFNCHGMTFASRRTGIYDSATLGMILQDDGYEEVPQAQVLAGDVILYIGDDGDIEHSGIVVEPPRGDFLNVPMVRSKWAKYREIVHPGNHCPYAFNVKYFRIKK